MRLGIISDIHGNYEGLAAALDHLNGMECMIVCLGDLVSDDSDDNDRCIQAVKEQGIQCVIGQHDDTCVKVGMPEVSDSSTVFLESMPETMIVKDVLCVHDNPLENARAGKGMWQSGSYIRSVDESSVVFDEYDFKANNILNVLIGHTHVPKIFTKVAEHDFRPGSPFRLEAGVSHIINPGRIGGRERELDAICSYALMDCDEGVVTLYAL